MVKNLGLSEDERKSVAAIIVAIKRYIEGHINKQGTFVMEFSNLVKPSMIFSSIYES